MKDIQTEQHLCWSSMTDIERTTSGSNEEDYSRCKVFRLCLLWDM